MQILTPTGYKPLEDLYIGSEVLAYDVNDGHEIINTIELIETITPNTYSKWTQDEDGNNLEYIPDELVYYRINGQWDLCKYQSIWRNNNEVVHATDLIIGDVIFDDEDKDVVITSIETLQPKETWIRFVISGDHSYIVDGLTYHNASRYWVGGGSSANWNATANTNWGSASNTQDNASVPGSTDDVYFDGVGVGASNSTLSANISINSLDMTGYANTLTHNASVALTIAGSGVNYKLATGMTYTKGNTASSSTAFTGTSGTTYIYCRGKSLGNTTFNGVGGTWELGEDFVSSGNLITTNGTFTTGSSNYSITTGYFTSNNSNIRTITLGSSTLTITLTAASAFNFATSTNLTFNGSNSTIIFNVNSTSGSGAYWGNQTFGTVWINTSGTGVFTTFSNGSFQNLKIDAGRTFNVSNGVTLTLNGNPTLTGSAGNLITLQSVVAGNTWYIVKSSGTVSCDYLQLRDSAASGGATFYAGANSTDVSGNTGWIFSAAPSTTNSNFFSFF